jgi:hypothetical protein
MSGSAEIESVNINQLWGNTMSFIEISGLGDVQEDQVQPEGDYNLIVVDRFTYQKEGASNYIIRIKHAIEGIDNALPVTLWLSLPGPDDEPDILKFKLKNLARYLHTASIPFEGNGFNDEDIEIGTTFTCHVTCSEPDDNGNVYNNIQLPRLPYEG